MASFLVVLGFELMALHLLGRCYTTFAMPPAPKEKKIAQDGFVYLVSFVVPHKF
jgi:hypothetical protein